MKLPDDYILWLGIDSLLAGHGGNKEFFTKKVLWVQQPTSEFKASMLMLAF